MDFNRPAMEIPEDFTEPEVIYEKLKKRILIWLLLMSLVDFKQSNT